MFKYFYNFIDKIKAKLNQKGQGMVEYALIIAFVAAIAAVALKSNLGSAVEGAFKKAATAITNAGETNANNSGSTTTTPSGENNNDGNG